MELSQHWINMSWYNAKKQLRTRGWSRAEIQEAHDNWLEQRGKQKSTADKARAERARRERAWADVVADINGEIQSARSGLQYWKPARSLAFNSFYSLYVRTLIAMRQVMYEEISYDDGILPNVAHWSDLMDWAGAKFIEEIHGMKPTQGLRQKILNKYKGLPFTEGRRKKPIMSFDVAAERKNLVKLTASVANTLDGLKRLALVNPDDASLADIDRLESALTVLDDWDFTAPLPATWHGLFK
jgi:hypothetical protein